MANLGPHTNACKESRQLAHLYKALCHQFTRSGTYFFSPKTRERCEMPITALGSPITVLHFFVRLFATRPNYHRHHQAPI